MLLISKGINNVEAYITYISTVGYIITLVHFSSVTRTNIFCLFPFIVIEKIYCTFSFQMVIQNIEREN